MICDVLVRMMLFRSFVQIDFLFLYAVHCYLLLNRIFCYHKLVFIYCKIKFFYYNN